MNDVQRKATDAANEKMRPAMELYEGRSRISYLVGMLPLRDLKRLVALLNELTEAELREVAAYAEGLAAWRLPAQESSDAQNVQPDTPAATGPGAR